MAIPNALHEPLTIVGGEHVFCPEQVSELDGFLVSQLLLFQLFDNTIRLYSRRRKVFVRPLVQEWDLQHALQPLHPGRGVNEHGRACGHDRLSAVQQATAVQPATQLNN